MELGDNFLNIFLCCHEIWIMNNGCIIKQVIKQNRKIVERDGRGKYQFFWIQIRFPRSILTQIFSADDNLFFIVMHPLPSDTVYNHLKGRGLILSPISKIEIPKPQEAAQSFMSVFTSFLPKKQKPSNDHSLKLFPILNSAFLVGIKDKLYLYKYKIGEQFSEIVVDKPQIIQLKYNICQIVSCDTKYVQDRGQVPFIILGQEGLSLFMFDTKEILMKQKNFVKEAQLYGISFINEKQILGIDNKRNLVQFTISLGLLKKKQTLQSPLILDRGSEKIIKTWIFGSADEEQDAMMVVFYAIKKLQADDQNFTLRVKEYIRTLDGDLIEIEGNSDYEVPSMKLENHPKLSINAVGDYFCIQMLREVLILKKKFEKYMFLDNMMEKIHGCEIYLNTKGLITSVGEKSMELNCIHFGDPRCVTRICDVIEFENQELEENHMNFKQVWPILVKKEYSLIFVFVKDMNIILSHLVKRQAMEKMLSLVKREKQGSDRTKEANKQKKLTDKKSTDIEGPDNKDIDNELKNRIKIIKDMAHNLGVTTKDFYLKLWNTSKKNIPEIYQYLLPCEDIPSIKRQLQYTLRKRTINVSEMITILEKMSEIIEKKLKTQLNHSNLKEFVKNDFLKRKIKMNPIDKPLDHQMFDKIYNDSLIDIFKDIINRDLFPKEKIIDPLHVMVEQKQEDEKLLKDVFLEFKVLLLEDYKDFLIELFKDYKNDIVKVLRKYYFLLPHFPCKIKVQKPSKTNEPIIIEPKNQNEKQSQWFELVTVKEWKSQLTKESIMEKLHYDYPTSKLNDTLHDFVKSSDGKNKRFKHGLIIASLDEYIEKVTSLNGINLYLEICQFANEQSIMNEKGDPFISEEIINILQRENELKGQKLKECKLYSSMHYFMLKNDIATKENLQILKLKNLQEENLVALFFLENKQKKQYIFKEFMDLYRDEKAKFRALLQKFVNSENCSRIELQILMNEIINRGVQFQQENQEIIELLIMGICTKLEIRQSLLILQNDDSESLHSHSLIEDIKMSKQLALKISRIKQLKKCRQILKNFQCEKMTYEELISLERDNEIFKMLMEKYFNGDMISFSVQVEERTIELENNPMNMLTVFIFLRENVYYSIQPREMLFTFGQCLIDWTEFQIVSMMIYEENTLEFFDIQDRDGFTNELISRAIYKIYNSYGENVVFEVGTRRQIENILQIIQDGDSQLKIRQQAKLQLASLLQTFEIDINLQDVTDITESWKLAPDDRWEFIYDLIEKYSQKLDFEKFINIYIEIERTSEEKRDVSITNNDELNRYCIMYAKKLLQKERYVQTIQILNFLMNNNEKIDHQLLSESLLKSMINIYQKNVQVGKKMIEFFVENNALGREDIIKEIFEKNFHQDLLLDWEKDSQILITPQYLYSTKKGQCRIEIEEIWKLANEESTNPLDLFYNYYFLLTGLNYPEMGFAEFEKISYNLQQITNIFLVRFEDFINKKEEYWVINYDSIFDVFYEGLKNYAKCRLEMNKRNKVSIDTLLEILKKDKQNNADLIKCLTKAKQEQRSRMKKEQRKKRFTRLLSEAKEPVKEIIYEEQQDEVVDENKDKQQVFLTWRQIQDQKYQLSQKSEMEGVNEQDLIQSVFISYEDIEFSRKKEKPNLGKKFKTAIERSILPSMNVGQAENLIMEEKYDEVRQKMDNKTIKQALESIVEHNPEKKYLQILEIMDKIQTGDPKKREMIKMYPIFQGNLPENVISSLFPIEFFFNSFEAQYMDNEHFRIVYEEIRPKIKEVVVGQKADFIKELANFIGHILESAEYSSWVYYEALVYIGENLQFISDHALFSQEMFDGLNEYPSLVADHFSGLLDSFKKDKEMRNYVRENLARMMEKRGYNEIVEKIRAY